MYMREFAEMNLYPNGFHSLREADHYKAAILYTICRILRPETVVETGVASGISTTGILAALERNSLGKLFSIDLPGTTYVTDSGTLWKDVTLPSGPGWLIPGHLKGRWTLIIGDSRGALTNLLSLHSEIDMFYHDSEHTNETMSFELKSAEEKLVTGGVMAVDNTNWSVAVGNFLRSGKYTYTMLYPFVTVMLAK
nr:class I SAM-dependent methyltransferase [Ferrimicrobium acidiphilum]